MSVSPSLKMTVVKLVQLLNALSPITLQANFAVVKLVFPLNFPFSTLTDGLPYSIIFKLVKPSKGSLSPERTLMLLPIYNSSSSGLSELTNNPLFNSELKRKFIVVEPFSKISFFILLPLNAFKPISVTLLGMVKEERPVQP